MECKGCNRCFNNIGGSGVLIFTDSKIFPGEHDIVLVKDHTETYNDAGGKSDGLESTATASNELYEETRGLINIDSRLLATTRYIDIGKNKHKYRCYIIHIPKISCSEYYCVDTSNMSNAFHETSGMTRFPARHIRDLIRRGVIKRSLLDDKFKQCPINDRVKDVLKKLFK